MNLPVDTNFKLDDIHLQKSSAAEKIKKFIDFASKEGEKTLTKTASVSKSDLIQLFSQMLDQLGLELGSNSDNIAQKLSSMAENKISSRINNSSVQNSIKIVSKSQKDSHYQIDVSKDLITHKGNNVFMISCYARDAYLGRYLIKRNYFFTPDREASANDTYDEISKKMEALKDRYYNEILDVSGIFAQAKKILDGVVSEVEFKEDTLGSTVSR